MIELHCVSARTTMCEIKELFLRDGLSLNAPHPPRNKPIGDIKIEFTRIHIANLPKRWLVAILVSP